MSKVETTVWINPTKIGDITNGVKPSLIPKQKPTTSSSSNDKK